VGDAELAPSLSRDPGIKGEKGVGLIYAGRPLRLRGIGCLVKLNEEGEKDCCVNGGDSGNWCPDIVPPVIIGGEAEVPYMFASWAWVNDRPDWDRKELVRPMEDDGRTGCTSGPEGCWGWY